MVVWLVSLLFVVTSTVTGYFRGAVRAGLSFIGLAVALMLAAPVGELFQPVLRFLGPDNPFVMPFLAPVVVFFLLSAAAKIAAAPLHARVENHFKYSENHTNQVAFSRFSSRVGACAGAFNGVIYAIALLTPFYMASYATLQLPESDTGSSAIRLANSVGRGARDTGFDKVLAGYTGNPKGYYSGADLLASILNSPGIYNRIHLYPDMARIAESPEVAEGANDPDASALFTRKTPTALGDLLAHPKVRPLVTRTAFANQVAAKLTGDTADFAQYLKTGTSPKFSDESIIGVWAHAPDDTLQEARRKGGSITSKEMAKVRSNISTNFVAAEFTVYPSGKARLVTRAGLPNAVSTDATWKKDSSAYSIRVADGVTQVGVPKFLDLRALSTSDTLLVTKDETTFVFRRRL